MREEDLEGTTGLSKGELKGKMMGFMTASIFRRNSGLDVELVEADVAVEGSLLEGLGDKLSSMEMTLMREVSSSDSESEVKIVSFPYSESD